MFHRRETRPVKVGNIQIGGNDQVVIQSMTTTKTHDVKATVEQIKRLEEAGCQIVRVAVRTCRRPKRFSRSRSEISVPLVADIHFDYRLALKAIEGGIDKIRINPGNIGRRDKVEAVVKADKERGIPIRIGVNAGSLEKRILEKYGYPTADGMVESALYHIGILRGSRFYRYCSLFESLRRPVGRSRHIRRRPPHSGIPFIWASPNPVPCSPER